MQLQQLRYLIAAAQYGSFRAASQRLFVSQSSLSVAIKDLEQETGVSVFNRTSRGISITPEGAELLAYARRVIEQADLMEARYLHDGDAVVRFGVSSQHYGLVVEAFSDFVTQQRDEKCEFSLHETYTNEIIRNVQEGHSELGIIYLSNYNDRIITRALETADLRFASLFVAQPHAVVSKNHPLAAKESIALDELADYYRFEQEQGIESSSYYAEEPLSAIAHNRRIVVSDNGSLAALIASTDGYAISTGLLPASGSDLAAVPLDTDEFMNVGAIYRKSAQISPLAHRFLALLAQRIFDSEAPIEPSSLAFDYLRFQQETA